MTAVSAAGPHAPDAAHDTPAEDSDARARGWRRMGLRLVGSALILSLLFWVLPMDELGSALRRIPGWVWALAVPGYLSLHLIGIAKWRMLINAADGGLRFMDALRCYYYGLFGNTFLPSLVGGDAVRAGLAFRLARNRSGVVFGSVLDRMLDVVGLATVAGVGALLVPGALDAQNRRVFLVLIGMGAVAGLVGLAVLAFLPARRFPMKVRRILVKLRHSLRQLTRQPGVVLAALAMGITLQTSLVFFNAWLGWACGIEIPLVAWLFAWPMAKISALVPVTQGGIGVREAALAALLAPFGVPAVLAVAAGLVFQAVIISGGLVGGLISWLLGRRQA